jgi:hypothetical protein
MSCPFGVVKIGAKPDDEITTGADTIKGCIRCYSLHAEFLFQKLALRS